MKILSEKVDFLKKHSITIIAVLALAVALCCVVAFSGNEPAEDSAPIDEPSAVTELSGVGIYADGELLAVLDSEETASSAVSEAISARVSALGLDSAAEYTFVADIELKSDSYSVASLSDKSSAVALMSDKLSVRSVVTVDAVVTIPHESKIIYTDMLRDGVEKLVTKGYDGEGIEYSEIVYIDGVESSRNVVSLEVTVEATSEVLRVGTSSDGIDTATLGTFIKPYDAIVTSYIGPRWGRTHNGIDIAKNGCYGDSAVSAADGVVVFSGWRGGYGNCVIVDHGNGIETLYAHFSKLSVSVGDIVSAGDEVGLIGSTGNSTGPHLHFEVHVDGEIVNPLIFVDYSE